jgi:hypothetical protein
MQRWRRGGNGSLLVVGLVPACSWRQFRGLPSDFGQRSYRGQRGDRGWHRDGDAEDAIGRADPDRRGPEPRTDEHCAEGRGNGHASPGADGCAGLRDAGAEGPDSGSVGGSDSDAGAQGADGRSVAGANRAAAGAERFAVAPEAVTRRRPVRIVPVARQRAIRRPCRRACPGVPPGLFGGAAGTGAPFRDEQHDGGEQRPERQDALGTEGEGGGEHRALGA